jgi:lysyl-tRNA synthetase class I
VLQAVDDALKSAAEAEKKKSNGADKAFKNAVNMLTDYGRNHHPEEAVAERMEKAEEEDKSSLKVLNRLKETFRVREELTPLLRRILILILATAAGGRADNGSRVSSPRVSS